LNIFLLFILAYIINKILPNFNNNYDLPYTRKQVFIFGIFSTVLVLFPYWIVGHTPTFTDWNSRHQLLIPFGMSFIFFSIYYYLKVKRFFLIMIITVSINININFYFELFRDWNKQIDLTEKFELINNEISNEIIFVNDNTPNAIERVYRYYEWNGLFKWKIKNFNNIVLDIRDYQSNDYIKLIEEKYPAFIDSKINFISINYDKPNILMHNKLSIINLIVFKINQYLYPKFNIVYLESNGELFHKNYL